MPKLLLNIFNPLLEPESLPMVGASRDLKTKPEIYEANNLNILLDKTAPEPGSPYKVVRFLLRKNGDLMFAAEGAPNERVPAHWQMTGAKSCFLDDPECHAAGNAFFDENNQMCVINHKSGDFCPPFNSLKFALRAFESSNVPMKKQITVTELGEHACFIKDHSISFEKSVSPAKTVTPIEIIIPPVKIIAPIEIVAPVDVAPVKKKHRVKKVVPPAEIVPQNYEDKLNGCGDIGAKILKQIKRLENGASSHNPYWMNSSKKLKAIIKSINEELPNKINEATLKTFINDRDAKLHKALNISRLSPITFFGKLRTNDTRTLQSIQNFLGIK